MEQRIYELDILRTLAIIVIVLWHICGLEGNIFSIFSFTKAGSFGIIVFFAIAGFLMKDKLFNTPKNALTFLKSRIIRILPLYYIALIFSMIILYYFTPRMWLPQEVNFNVIFSHFVLIQSFLPIFITDTWFISTLFIFYIFFIIIENFIKNKFHAVLWLIFLWIPIFIAFQDDFFLFYGSIVYIAMVVGYITGLWYNFYKPEIMTNCPKFFIIVSYSSYSIFLFHIPLISLIFIYLSKLNLNFEINFIVFLILGLSTSIVAGYIIQNMYDKFIRLIKNILVKP